MYIARDKDGSLYLFRTRPAKYDKQNIWLEKPMNSMIKLDSSLFPEVKWEDEEPTEVLLVQKKNKLKE